MKRQNDTIIKQLSKVGTIQKRKRNNKNNRNDIIGVSPVSPVSPTVSDGG